MSAKVWVLGDAVVDLLPESDGRLLPCPGGAPANVAVGIARLGGTSGFIGRVPGYSQVCPLRDYLQMREKCDELSISLNVAERLQ